MARAALQWSTDELAARSSVGRATVQRFEQGRDTRVSTVDAIERAFTAAGIRFTADGCVCSPPDLPLAAASSE
jgi:transcriptional regulator with XRE-family HTH domain